MAGGPNPRRERDPVLVVAGPTASGKSEMAADAARKFDGVVINADSMQMYRDLSVLSARPTAAQIGEIPHRLFGVLDAADVCSAGRWREMARHELQAARRGGKLPIVVGGTGLYLKALIHGISDIPEIPAEIRIEVRNRVAAMGPERLHAELTVRDPKTAARLDPRDRQRIARALEVIEATGARLSDWTAAPSPASDDCENDFVVCALLPELQRAYPAVAQHADHRLRAAAR